MQLKDFIKESLSQIISGIAETQQETLPNNAEISPYITVQNIKTTEKKMKPQYTWQHATPIKFDIAVTAEESTGTKEGLVLLLVFLL